nr:hypothetical protein [Prescottella equi]
MDESCQIPDPVVYRDKTFYAIAAVVVQQNEMEDMRTALSQLAEVT